MLPDETLHKAAEKLADFRRQDDLSEILEQYATLIEDYKRLKSDYEEEREGRERYKQLARGQERNPFALVLVDGDGYVFDERFVTAGQEGGSKAAKQLNDAIKSNLRRKNIEGCEVMVRVYADLVGLSKCLCKNSLCGPEKRSLAPFTAGFNRSYGLTDFVDAGELKENADYKLKALLRLYADNAQCKHIYFAACHDVGYIADLTPHRGSSDRFTLIRTPSLLFHKEFAKLGMNIEELPGVFRTTPLAHSPATMQTPTKTVVSPYIGSAAGLATSPTQPSSNDGNAVCQFHIIGKCRYGRNCHFSHPDVRPPKLQNDSPPPYLNQNWRSDNDTTTNSSSRTSGFSDAKNDVTLLPRHHDIPDGHVAVNGNQERLDAYIAPPSSDAMKRLKAISVHRKFCNNKQLTNSCDNPNCEYDHTPIPDDLKLALELLSRSMPCPKRGACRRANCVYGHVCQKVDCKHRGGKAYCRFPLFMCLGDFVATDFVPGTRSSPSTVWDDGQNTEAGAPLDEEEEDLSEDDST